MDVCHGSFDVGRPARAGGDDSKCARLADVANSGADIPAHNSADISTNTSADDITNSSANMIANQRVTQSYVLSPCFS